MSNLFEYDLFDTLINPEVKFNGFSTFCENIDELSMMINPMIYLEAVVDKKNNVKSSLGNVIKRTIKTTKDVGTAYGNVTTGGGDIISSFFNLGMSVINLTVRIISFILTQLSKIPNMIANLINNISEIPTEIKNLIRGNIKLLITADSVKMFYVSIFPLIMRFLNLSKELAAGDTWKTFFNVLKGYNIGDDLHNLVLSRKDTKICKEMKSTVQRLYNFDITPTTIEMTDSNIVDIYFSNKKVINFTDLQGRHHEDSYFGALMQLYKDLGNGKGVIETLYKDLGSKYSNNKASASLAKVNLKTQEQIGETIQYVSVVVNIIGKFMSCTIKDMKTIKNSYNAISKKMNVKNQKIEDSKKVKK